MPRTTNDPLALSQALEQALVARNLRGMAAVRAALPAGYLLRAATALLQAPGIPLIATGFPVGDTFETDGPVGALELYSALERLDRAPLLLCEAPLAPALAADFRVLQLPLEREALERALPPHHSGPVISIERPGQAADGRYYNMRGEDISARVAPLDAGFAQCHGPRLAIGDGGNELGMGRAGDALADLAIIPAISTCDELIVADVSNWGAYGLIAMLGWLTGRELLAQVEPVRLLHYLSAHGSVDGVSRRNDITEDGLPASEGLALIAELQRLCAAAGPALKRN